MDEQYNWYNDLEDSNRNGKRKKRNITIKTDDGTEMKIYGEKKGIDFPTAIALFLIFGGFGALIGSMVFSQWLAERGLAWITIGSVGILFFGFGFAAVIADTKIGWLFMLIGSIVFGSSAYYAYASQQGREIFMEGIVPMMLLSVFLIMGVCVAAIVPYIYIKNKRIHSMQVDAEVIRKTRDYYRDSDGHSRRTYHLTWKYYAGGEWRNYRSNIGRSHERRDVGDRGILWLNPDNYDDCWEDIGWGWIAAAVIGGIALMLFVGFCMYMFAETQLAELMML